MLGTHAIDHGSSRAGRWLREKRFRFTLWLAAIEGLLYVFHVLHWWAAVGLAVIAVGSWWYAGRTSRSDALRQVTWIFSASQLIVLLIPIVLKVATWAAYGAITLLAIAALFVLFRERS
jgi:hypothetical protein